MVYITMTNRDEPDHLELEVTVVDNDASDPFLPPFKIKYAEVHRVDLSAGARTIDYTIRAPGRQANAKTGVPVKDGQNFDVTAGAALAMRDRGG